MTAPFRYDDESSEQLQPWNGQPGFINTQSPTANAAKTETRTGSKTCAASPTSGASPRVPSSFPGGLEFPNEWMFAWVLCWLEMWSTETYRMLGSVWTPTSAESLLCLLQVGGCCCMFSWNMVKQVLVRPTRTLTVTERLTTRCSGNWATERTCSTFLHMKNFDWNQSARFLFVVL